MAICQVPNTRGEQKIIFENLSTGFKCQQDNENDLFDCNTACRLMNQILTLHDSANAFFVAVKIPR